MDKRNSKKLIHELYDLGISAHECTGLIPTIETDPDEIAKFHSEYIGEE